MNLKRESVMWGGLAVAAIALLLGVLAWQQNLVGRRATTYVQPNPEEGSAIFIEKGCATCHGTDGAGGSAPSLRGRESLSTLPQLVTAMWNHAPRMWQAIDEQKLSYPSMNYEETGQLVSYLYFSRYADQAGDPKRGRKVFEQKQCWRCHSLKPDESNNGATELTSSRIDYGARTTDFSSPQSVDNPIVWTQVMWNHASRMQVALNDLKIQWPRFQANEMRDLIAYVRSESGAKKAGFSFPATDPDEGWKVFQRKACIECHSINASSSGTGPALGPERPLPPSFSEFGAVMLNHFPKMQQAMSAGGKPIPTFEGREMSDLVGFIYSLHYVEPSGVAPVGESIFAWRGCAHCHGTQGQGTREGPPLRGRGNAYTATRLATDLWRHGSRMYQQNNRSSLPWPMLQENDIGNLLAFLNSPLPR